MRVHAHAVITAPKKAASGGYGLNPLKMSTATLRTSITVILGIETDSSPITSIDFTRQKTTEVSPVERTFCIHHPYFRNHTGTSRSCRYLHCASPVRQKMKTCASSTYILTFTKRYRILSLYQHVLMYVSWFRVPAGS